MNIVNICLLSAALIVVAHAAGMSEQEQLDRAIALSLSDIHDDAPVAAGEEPDAATAALIAALMAAEGGPAVHHAAAADIDLASAELIEALRMADFAGVAGAPHISPIFIAVHNHAHIVAHRATLAPIVAHLTGVAQNADVHTLDGHVTANLAALHAMGDDFGVDNPNLTVADMRGYLVSFLGEHPGFYTGYVGQAVTHEALIGYIDAALARASEQAPTLRMYSRVISLIQRLDAEGIDNRTYLQHMFDAIAENYLTHGGCFEGVRNRIYVRYVSIMNTLMGA